MTSPLSPVTFISIPSSTLQLQSINRLNTHTSPTSRNSLILIFSLLISLDFFFPALHLFPFSFICCIRLLISSSSKRAHPSQINTWINPIPKRGQGKTEPLENAIFLFLISGSIRSGQRWVPWQYVYLYMFYKEVGWRWRWWWSAYQCLYLGGLGRCIGSSSYMKNNVVYGYTFIYNGNMGSGLFYNVPYFRLGLTAFYGPPAVHLHVAGRQEHCIIMSFPAPKCYFTGRGSFLKLHHFYNFPNFYFRHYYQQDFITYLECKQV